MNTQIRPNNPPSVEIALEIPCPVKGDVDLLQFHNLPPQIWNHPFVHTVLVEPVHSVYYCSMAITLLMSDVEFIAQVGLQKIANFQPFFNSVILQSTNMQVTS